MGLINLQTNLKSLRFGNDRFGNGNSGQPYIQTPIPDQLPGSGTEDFILRGGLNAIKDAATDVLRLGKYFSDPRNPDGLLFIAKQNLLSRTAVRTQASGILNEGIYTPLSTLVEAGLVAFGGHVNKQGLNPFDGPGSIGKYNDVVTQFQSNNQNRLVNIYKDKQDQPSFTLSLDPVNVRTYTGGPNSILGIGKTNIRFADQRTGEASGHGPKYLFGLPNGNGAIGSNTDRTDISLNYNRGLGLSLGITDKNSNKSLSDSQYTGFNQAGQLLSETEARNAKPSEPSKVLISPPSSFKPININGLKLLGASNKFFTSLTPADNGFTPDGTQSESPLNTGNNRTYTYSQADLVNIPRSTDGVDGISFYIGKNLTTTGVGDFRKKLRKNATSTQNINNLVVGNITNAPNYFTKNIEQRVNLGDPGDTNLKNLTSYTNGSDPGQIVGKSGGNASPASYDKINALPIYLSENAAKVNEVPVNDLVKFRIGVIDNDNPSLKTYIHFRAFLNQITDQYSSDWSDTRYIGRGEKFYTYAGFDRKVSLGWTVAAQSKAELIPMYKKLNYLASVCAPDYSGNGYLRGNIVTLTIGGYFYEQPGIITGFSYEMNDDNATWEIGINDEGENDSTVKELPHLIKVSGFNFIPIHTFVPRKQQMSIYGSSDNTLWDPNKYGPERYIALDNGVNNNYGEPYSPPNPTPPPPTPTPAPTPNPPPNQQQALFGIQDVSGPGGSAQRTVPPLGGNPLVEPLVNEGNTGVTGFSKAELDKRSAIFQNR